MTSKISVITQAIVDLLRADPSLGLHDVFYGDVVGIPRVPAASVIPGAKDRKYTQTGLQTTVDVSIDIIVFYSRVTDKQNILKANDELAEAIEDALHVDNTLGGLVINGLVNGSEPGYVSKGKALFTAHRLTWNAKVKERIGV